MQVKKILFLLLALIFLVESSHVKDSDIYDLEFQGRNFKKEAESWQLVNAELTVAGVKTSQCGDITLLGGPSVATTSASSFFWQKTFTVPTFNGGYSRFARIQFTAYPLDEWKDDTFALEVDNKIVPFWFLNTQKNSYSRNVCGAGKIEIPPINVTSIFKHTKSTMTVKIHAIKDGGTRVPALGIRNFFVTFFTSPSDNEEMWCGVADWDLGHDGCSCPLFSHTGGSNSGKCTSCDNSCLQCNAKDNTGCTACTGSNWYSPFLQNKGKCESCKAPCQTCSGGPNYCTSCQTGYFLVGSTCYPECPPPLVQIVEGRTTYCESKCSNPNDYAYWDGTCSGNCPSPLVDKKIASYLVCTFPCSNSNAFLYWDGTCKDECPQPYQQFPTPLGGKLFCVFPCPNGETYHYWNGTCKNDCPSPLVSKGQEGAKQLCLYPCDDDQFLYTNGKCFSDCPFPNTQQITQDKKKFCLSPCAKEGEYKDRDGSCRSMDLPGQFELTVAVDDKSAKVTFIDNVISADNFAFSLYGREHTLSSSWTFFGLNSMGEYLLDNWDTVSQCGCFKHCGRDCKAIECYDNSKQASIPFFCNDDSKRESYCWGLISSGSHPYTSYNLTYISTIALTSYGGPDASFVSPGFTITNRIATQNSALNGLIMDFSPRQKVNLAASYRYAESEGRVITAAHFANINTRPTITADLTTANCTSNSMHLPLFLTHKTDETMTPFKAYTILRKATKTQLNDLKGKYILTPIGVLEWKNQRTFDILDPCNQQFFTLRMTADGKFLVDIPPFQTLTVPNLICVAINDVPGSQYDLVLYELVIGTSTWSASDRFVGLLSKDYLEDLTVRTAVKADKTLIPSTLAVKVDFHANNDIPYFAFSTSRAAKCHVYLSPTCEFDISTTSAMLYKENPVQKKCGFLYEKAGYNCQGVMGYFYPPPSFVKTPISHYSENTTFLNAHNEDFSAAQASTDHQSLLSIFMNYFTGWTLQNTPTKLVPIILFALLFIVILCVFKKNEDSKQQIEEMNEEEEETAMVDDS